MALTIRQGVIVEDSSSSFAWLGVVVSVGTDTVTVRPVCPMDSTTTPVTVPLDSVRIFSSLEEHAARKIQEAYRRRQAYKQLVDNGTIWAPLRADVASAATSSGEPQVAGSTAIRALSRWNLRQILEELRAIHGAIRQAMRDTQYRGG